MAALGTAPLVPAVQQHPGRLVAVEDLIAQEAMALRRSLIGHHGRGPVGRQDLEDVYSQATLELLARAKRGPTLRTRAHVRNALRQKFADRVLDEQRARAGRSPAADGRAHAQPLDDAWRELVNDRDAPTQLIALEEVAELRDAISGLTSDQRLVLSSQLAGEPPRDCRKRAGWSNEKYRLCRRRHKRY
jgi:DNA-directed RNA polymerase specialized sigma24 family protein